MSALAGTRYPREPLRPRACGSLLFLLSSFALTGCAWAQSNGAVTEPGRESTDPATRKQFLPDALKAQDMPVSFSGLPARVLHDEIHFVTFPHHTTLSDLKWLVPLTGATVAAFALDEKTMSEVVSSGPSFNGTSRNVSDGLRDGFMAVPVAMLGVGALTHHNHSRETGLLASEAMIDAYTAGELVKLATFRERPYVDHSEGSFYRLSAGTDSSFVSGHSLVAWSSAAVLAEEYPGRWRQTAVYTLATGVSLTRVLGQKHFPSDVLLGSAAGWLIGHYVYRRHHHRFKSLDASNADCPLRLDQPAHAEDHGLAQLTGHGRRDLRGESR